MNKFFNIYFYVLIFFLNSCLSQKDSVNKTYYKNGKIASIGVKINGLQQGEWKYFDDSLGYVKKIINYKDNNYHGVYIEFYQNKKIKKNGYYDRNFMTEKIDENGNTSTYAIPIGSWDFYDINGNLIKTEVHDCTGFVLKILPEK